MVQKVAVKPFGEYQEIQFFTGSDKPRMLFFLLIKVAF